LINHALYFTSPYQISVVEQPVPSPREDEVLVKNQWSAISAGTEMLLLKGLMPNDLELDENIPALKQQLKYPFKYGYCAVGKIMEVGSHHLNHLLDKWVFVFNPHESYFCVHRDQIILLPDNISPMKALLIPSMETAVNLLLDGNPLIGEKVVILGLGIIGLLTTLLLRQFPLATLVASDLHPKRRELGHKLGADLVTDGVQDLRLGCGEIDLVYELTGNPDALNSAINYVGFEGRIVLGSWYGKKDCAINLGGKFHRNRIKIISSQVSTLASELRGRWDKARRLNLVFKMLEKIDSASFISHQFPVEKANDAYQLILNKPEECLLVTFNYKV
jgi:2-desacetyl-2-hydroxyethyl bacteriochlorophyllide A dehydrogenase